MPSSCLQPLLCVLLPFHLVGGGGGSPLPPHARNPDATDASTIYLVFDSGPHGNLLRNCSCPVGWDAVRSCDDARANLLCSCSTLSRSALTPDDGRRKSVGALALWVRRPWVLRDLLNGSRVQELRLSLCARASAGGGGDGGSVAPLAAPGDYVALVGLKRLWVQTAARELAVKVGRDGSPGVAFLDTDSLNATGEPSLKSYSVLTPSLNNFNRNFPNLALPRGNLQGEPEHLNKPAVLTFIY